MDIILSKKVQIHYNILMGQFVYISVTKNDAH